MRLQPELRGPDVRASGAEHEPPSAATALEVPLSFEPEPDPRIALEAERRRVLEEAWTSGYEKGRREGSAAVVEDAAGQLDQLRRACEALSRAVEGEIADSEDMLVEIAFEAVRRVLGEVLAKRDGVAAVVRQVMAQVSERERLVVRVAPADRECLERVFAESDPDGTWRRFDLVADDRVGLGGCLLETSGGTLDGRIETQMEQLREALLDARRLRSETPD